MGLIALPKPSDWTLDSGVEIVSATNSIGLRLAKTNVLFEDNFNDNSLDTIRWTVYDPGGKVVEQNSRLEVTGSSSWNTNGVLGKTGISIDTLFTEFAFTVIPQASSNTFMVGLDEVFSYAPHGVFVYPGNPNILNIWLNSAAYRVGQFAAGKTYNFRFIVTAKQIKIYLSSPDDSNYVIETLLWTSFELTNYTFYPVFNILTGTIYFDNVSIHNFPTTSPTATSPWIGIPFNTLDASIAFSVLENQIAGLQWAPSVGSIKYKYALNNGADNDTWLTLAELLTAINGATITDHTNSLRLKVQFISNGTQAVDISGFGAFTQASGVAAAGGGLQIINGGIIHV